MFELGTFVLSIFASGKRIFNKIGYDLLEQRRGSVDWLSGNLPNGCLLQKNDGLTFGTHFDSRSICYREHGHVYHQICFVKCPFIANSFFQEVSRMSAPGAPKYQGPPPFFLKIWPAGWLAHHIFGFPIYYWGVFCIYLLYFDMMGEVSLLLGEVSLLLGLQLQL